MTVPALDVVAFQSRVYPSPPCWSLVADVYMNVLGLPVDTFKTIDKSVRDTARTFRLHLAKDDHGFERIDAPREYAVVLMGKTPRLGIHHCGIFYGGKVLHARDDGTLHQELFELADQYQLMEFWARSGESE